MLVCRDRKILSLGASCINTFQMGFFAEGDEGADIDQKTALFDWNICPPDATISLLRHAKMGALKATLSDRTRYKIHGKNQETRRITHDAFKGFLFFHEEMPEHVLGSDAGFDAFLSKTLHLVDNLFAAPEKQSVLFWSNLQPNLRETAEKYEGWMPFVLTAEQYGQIKSLARANFGDDAEFAFFSRPDDICESLHSKPDVVLMELARGEDFKGTPGLFDPHLALAAGL